MDPIIITLLIICGFIVIYAIIMLVAHVKHMNNIDYYAQILKKAYDYIDNNEPYKAALTIESVKRNTNELYYYRSCAEFFFLGKFGIGPSKYLTCCDGCNRPLRATNDDILELYGKKYCLKCQENEGIGYYEENKFEKI